MNLKIIRKINCFFGIFLCFSSCKCQTNSYALHSEVTKYTYNSISISSILGDNYTIVKERVKNNTLLLTAVKSDRCYFIGISLKDGKILFDIPDPLNDYVNSSFDITENELLSISALRPLTLYITNFRTKNISVKSIPFEKAQQPHNIIVSNSQLFLINDVYGVSVFNLLNRQLKNFHNEGQSGIVAPQLSTVSLPLDSSINVVTGHAISRDVLNLYAIDNQNAVLWDYALKKNQSLGSSTILSFEDLFAVKSDNFLIAIDKHTGEKRWDMKAMTHIREIYKVKKSILIYSVYPAASLSPTPVVGKISLKLIDGKTGVELWNCEVGSFGEPAFAIVQDRILITDNSYLLVFSLLDGKLLEKTAFPNNKRKQFSFQVLHDVITNDYYLKSYDNMIFW